MGIESGEAYGTHGMNGTNVKALPAPNAMSSSGFDAGVAVLVIGASTPFLAPLGRPQLIKHNFAKMQAV